MEQVTDISIKPKDFINQVLDWRHQVNNSQQDSRINNKNKVKYNAHN